MKIGIGLPTWQGSAVSGREVLDWARAAEDAGFHAVAVHDRPNHETWDPLASLAAVAAVTSRVRLVSGALLLPMRDEALVAKQATVIDRVSDGRLDLGVAVGARPEDFGLFGRTTAGRGPRFEAQLARLHDLWREAWETRDSGQVAGPASTQEGHPKLWVGGYAPAAVDRAVRFGDGFLFGAPGAARMQERIPVIHEAARAAGRERLPVGGLAYVLPSTDPAVAAESEALITRYYGSLHKPFPDLVHQGTTEQVVAAIEAYREAGLDVLHLIPVTRDRGVIDVLARDVLPRFAG